MQEGRLTSSRPFDFVNLFSSLLACRFALFVHGAAIISSVLPDTPEMVFLSLYLATGTVVLLADSPNRYWWSPVLQPNVHYIPVKVRVVERVSS